MMFSHAPHPHDSPGLLDGGVPGPANDIGKVDLQRIGDAEQGVERGVAQVPFNKADHGLGQAGTLRQNIHGNTTTLALLAQQTDDVETNGWANFNARSGAVRFWFRPNWSWDGTGTDGSFLFLGHPTSVLTTSS